MQHHPGSWYMPWGVPLQKMLAVPLHHPSVATVGYHQSQAAAAVQVAPGLNGQQPTHHQTYQQHQLHPALHQQLHHPGAAAAAMFTPLSLRTFISPISPTPTSQQTSHLHQNAQSHHQTHSHAHAHTHSNAQMQHSAAVSTHSHTNQSPLGTAINLNVGCVPLRQNSVGNMSNAGAMMIPVQKVSGFSRVDFFLSFPLLFASIGVRAKATFGRIISNFRLLANVINGRFRSGPMPTN